MCASPDFSPIEPAFGWLKARVKRDLPSHRTASDSACREILLLALGQLTPHKARGYWKFIYEVPQVLSAEQEEAVAAALLVLWFS